MKLLTKSQVSQEVNFQKKQQIDEGISIATRVDALRKTLGELELQYKEFATLKQKELDGLFTALEKEIQEKRYEIKILEERRIKLLKPLNEEWKQVKEAQSELETKEEEYNGRIIVLKCLENRLEARENGLAPQLKSLGEKITANELATKRTQVNLKKSEEILKSAEIKEKDINNLVSEKMQELLEREALMASKERELDIKNSQLEADKKEINNKRIQLEDREATLEREIKRRIK